MRTIIIGGPGTGKTTLADSMGGGRCTDEVMGLGWSESSAEVSTWFDQPGPWIIEGVAVPRALRKWKERNPGLPPPVDKIVHLTVPHKPLEKGAITMGKGVNTVLTELRPWLGTLI